MFPFWTNSCYDHKTFSTKASKERKLKFLKWVRDDLETRLSGVDAAISTLERQIERLDREEAN